MDSTRLHDIISQQTEFKWTDSIIHLFIGGSEAHGAKVGTTDDLDLYGVYIPPAVETLGISQYEEDEHGEPRLIQPEHYVWSTAGSHRRNGPDDIDLALYSLRKWATMAAKGNPTALHFLFTENVSRQPGLWHSHILPNRDAFLSSHAGLHFYHFSVGMLRRLKGVGVGKRGQREDLIREFGYDTKAAMHLMRVLNEGIELMSTGTITLPRPERQFLIDIRLGKYPSMAGVERMAEERFQELENLTKTSPLPAEVNRELISKVVSAAYMEAWTMQGEKP